MSNEIAREFFLDKNKSCSESVFLSADKIYGLNASDDCLKAAGAFSGGIGGCERICGAAAGAICALGLKYSTGDAHTSPEMREKCAGFMNEFMEFYGSDLCKVIKPIHRKADVRCLSVVKTALDILEKYM